MPSMSFTPKSTNDPSSLTNGWHPAFLLAILDEATPEAWMMYANSPRMYRWKFAVYANQEAVATGDPERQSAVSSHAFTPKGRNPASKAYIWTTELLARQVLPGEAVDLDPLMPLPCRVKIERREQYANIVDLERWEEGQPLLTAHVKGLLATLDERETLPPTRPPAPTTPAVAPAATRF